MARRTRMGKRRSKLQRNSEVGVFLPALIRVLHVLRGKAFIAGNCRTPISQIDTNFKNEGFGVCSVRRLVIIIELAMGYYKERLPRMARMGKDGANSATKSEFKVPFRLLSVSIRGKVFIAVNCMTPILVEHEQRTTDSGRP